MIYRHVLEGIACILSATALAACSGGGGNNAAAGAGSGGDGATSSAPTALTAAQLIGSRWRLDNDACPDHRTIEFQADAIVTPSRTIHVTYESNNIPSVLLVMPEGGTAASRLRFSLSNERLTMFNPDNGMPCVFVRA